MCLYLEGSCHWWSSRSGGGKLGAHVLRTNYHHIKDQKELGRTKRVLEEQIVTRLKLGDQTSQTAIWTAKNLGVFDMYYVLTRQTAVFLCQHLFVGSPSIYKPVVAVVSHRRICQIQGWGARNVSHSLGFKKYLPAL